MSKWTTLMINEIKVIEWPNPPLNVQKMAIFHVDCMESKYKYDTYTARYGGRCPLCKLKMPENMKIIRNLFNET